MNKPHIPLEFRCPLAFVWNMSLVYFIYWICRMIYLTENASAFPGFWSDNSLRDIIAGAWTFDTSAIMYTNALYALLMLIPIQWKEQKTWQHIAKIIFVGINGLAICINLADAAYFPYTGRRTTTTIFQEFANEDNLGSVFRIEVLRHWYLVLAGMLLIALLWKTYRKGGEESSAGTSKMFKRSWGAYYMIHLFCLAAYIPLTIIGMRGGGTTAVRPITISNATQYVLRPSEAAIILNTPFSLIRTIGKSVFVTPAYFSDTKELEAVYTPVHTPTLGLSKNDVFTQPHSSPMRGDGGALSTWSFSLSKVSDVNMLED